MNDKIYIEVGYIRIEFTDNGIIQLTVNATKFAVVRIGKEQMRKIAEFYMKALNK